MQNLQFVDSSGADTPRMTKNVGKEEREGNEKIKKKNQVGKFLNRLLLLLLKNQQGE